MANKGMTLEERYASFCNEAEAIKDELYKTGNTREIIHRLEKLINNTLADNQLCELEGYIRRLEKVLSDFKKNQETIDEVIEYVWVALDRATALRLACTEN